MKTNFKRKSLALAIGLLGVGAVAENAYAGAYTFASSQVNLTLYNSNVDGTVVGSIMDRAQFTPGLSAQDSASTSADLDSVAGISSGSSLVTGNAPLACQGTGCGAIGQNNFGQVGTGSWYARSDTNVTGVVITGLPNPADNNTPATGSTISEVSLTGNDIGISSANANNTTGFVFTVANGDTYMLFDLSATTATQSLLTADQAIPPAAAGSSGSWSITITDNATGATNPFFTWSPDALASTLANGVEVSDGIDLTFNSSVSSAGADTGLLTNTGSARAVSPLLLANHSYTLQITQTAQSNARAQLPVPAPEPSLLGLLGIGLLGAGASRLRRAKNSIIA